MSMFLVHKAEGSLGFLEHPLSNSMPALTYAFGRFGSSGLHCHFVLKTIQV